ncbi:hypothetical protein JRQ81_004820, partial [Phrynocephalus forsythii]
RRRGCSNSSTGGRRRGLPGGAGGGERGISKGCGPGGPSPGRSFSLSFHHDPPPLQAAALARPLARRGLPFDPAWKREEGGRAFPKPSLLPPTPHPSCKYLKAKVPRGKHLRLLSQNAGRNGQQEPRP